VNSHTTNGLNERGSCFGLLYGNEVYVCLQFKLQTRDKAKCYNYCYTANTLLRSVDGIIKSHLPVLILMQNGFWDFVICLLTNVTLNLSSLNNRTLNNSTCLN
jgi:hypothetical protein